jgi:hypothetical protein
MTRNVSHTLDALISDLSRILCTDLYEMPIWFGLITYSCHVNCGHILIAS